MTAARHLRLVPTVAEVIPLRPAVECTAQRHHTLTTVAGSVITRHGQAISVDGRPATPGLRAGLADTDRAGLTVWAAQGDGDHVAVLTQDGICVLALWGGQRPVPGAPGGGDAA